ncbi:C13 family peptidase [Microvirga lotononidis]|uniref:Peptidase C13 family n=1 Tax=Microvirga lotononidis TaxID=864069 RepID=I4YPL5_9HYPH|nr:C13 family peptidase [Microvirga lotononidis]EIM25907.1 Peptidase C13 family [Microvirga lotononidis]WQO25821.1 C13 family peptidase [Microvirga lotononidis]
MRRLLAFCLIGLSIAIGPFHDAHGQPARRADAGKLVPHRLGQTDVYILSFGLWGPQSVFESEARGAARILEANFDGKGRSIVRVNTKRRAGATPQTLMAAATAAGKALDPAEDIVVLVLTSHGGPEGIGLVAGRDALLVTPDNVRELLDRTRAENRVLIVSACYSGIFARELADPHTLVITAAAADKPSFGCRDGATWTYFGDAFFNKALRGERRLDVAFEQARGLVTQRERREGFDPSNPQIAGGEQVLARLKEAACRAGAPTQQAGRAARSATC